MSFKQAEIIRSIAETMRPSIYVELGIATAETFNLIHPHILNKAYAVDSNKDFVNYITNISGKIFPYHGSTQQFAIAWERDIREEIDLIFIDANHKKESVVEDATFFYKWLKSDYGLMILHDTWPPDEEHTSSVFCSDCYLAKDILKKTLPNVEFITLPWDYGLTLIRKRGDDWRNGSMISQFQASKADVLSSKTDIIIPSFGAFNYLKVTIESIKRNTSDYHLIIVNSGSNKEVRDYLLEELRLGAGSTIELVDSEDPLNFAEAVNLGLLRSKNDVVILNNDVIVGKEWLEQLRSSPFDITNPFSNCDEWVHHRNLYIKGQKLKPYMKLHEVNIEDILSTKSPYSEDIPAEWVALYATYIKRKVLNAVGELDVTFINGGEDIDFCRRASLQGFTCGFKCSSWVFHFGGHSRLVDSDGNYIQAYRQEDLSNAEYNKYKCKKTVCIHTGPAWETWTPDILNTSGIGGSETCAIHLSRQLVKNGYRCVVIGDCDGKEGTYDGVEYIHYINFDKFKKQNYVDHFISSRRFSPLTHPISNGRNYIWAHDIYVSDLPQPVPDNITFIVLSPWHQRFFCQHHNIDPSRTIIIGNGLDLSRFEIDKPQRDPNRLFYSSCPSRGLLTLLLMFREWKKEFPELNLHVFYGFDNWKKIIDQKGSDGQVEYLKEIEANLNQDGVYFHGRVSQKQLAIEQMKSSLWVYPTEFRETYCITANEAMIAGAVPVCTNFMTPQGPSTLDTTVPDGCGIKLLTPDACFDATKKLLRNKDEQESYRIKGQQHVRDNCGWDKVIKKWINLLEQNNTEQATSVSEQKEVVIQPNKRFKLAIGLPMLHPFVHYKFVNSYLALQRPEGSVTISLVGSLTALARNQIVDIAKNNKDFTHLLFLDTDMTFPADTIKKLLSYDKDIVSGLYFERYAPYRPMVRKYFEDGYSIADYTKGGLIECDALGAGCLLIKMEVFEKLSRPYFEYRLTQSGVKEHFLSEDIVFCERARKAGVKIYCDTSIRCGHLISDYEITEANWDGSTEFKTQNWG